MIKEGLAHLADNPPHDLWRKSPIEQKTVLAGFFLGIGGRRTEFPRPHAPGRRQILGTRGLDGSADQRFVDAVLPQFMRQAAAAVLAGPSMGEGISVAGVGELAALLQIIKHGGNFLCLAMGSELAGKFGPAMLAPGQQAERPFAEGQDVASG